MRRLPWVALLVLAAAGLGFAVAAVPAVKAAVAGSAGELLLVRPDGRQGRLVAYDMAVGRPAFSLPPGALAADGSRYVGLTSFLGLPRLAAYDPRTGALQGSQWLSRGWVLQAVSPTGRWAALVRPAATGTGGRRETLVSVVDLDAPAIPRALRLAGDFEVEAVSASGNDLFLIQHLPADPLTGSSDRYLVRLYDLSAGLLHEEPLVSKASVDAVMTGRAWDGLASPDGRWLLTLYLNTRLDSAFIHALNLELQLPICLDLPSGDGDPARLARYALAMQPHGGRVFAANPALGVVAEHVLDASAALGRGGVVTFQPPSAPTSGPTVSVISADGRYLYFASGSHIWAYDAAERTVAGPYWFDGQVAGLGLSSDGQRLHAAGADGALAVYSAATGELLQEWR